VWVPPSRSHTPPTSQQQSAETPERQPLAQGQGQLTSAHDIKGTISLRVLDDDLKPLAGSTVTIVESRLPPSDEKGQEISLLTPTSGALSIDVKPAMLRVTIASVGHASIVLPCTVGSSASINLGDVVLATGYSIHGVVFK